MVNHFRVIVRRGSYRWSGPSHTRVGVRRRTRAAASAGTSSPFRAVSKASSSTTERST